MTFEATESGTLFKAGTGSAMRFILKNLSSIIGTCDQTVEKNLNVWY